MLRRVYLRPKFGVAGLLCLVVAIAAWVLFAGQAKRLEWNAASEAALRKTSGHPQLISVEPLPVMDGEMCQWVPASAAISLRAALRQERLAAMEAGSEPDAAKRAEVASRKPLRTIRDRYSAYSSVAVDPIRNEVVVIDENLFNVLVYDRLENTAPTAAMSEPKRIIGGENTNVRFNCGLYIDPKSGDIYVSNNDSIDTMVIFSRQAKGNVAPDRQLETPHGTYGIAVDEEREEMYMTVQHDNAVVIFHKMAQGEDSPIRLLQGNRTQMADPHGIALDMKTNRLFVANYGSQHLHDDMPTWERKREGARQEKANWPRSTANRIPGSGRMGLPSITVYPRDASGDTPPLQVIQGQNTQLNWPAHLTIDEKRGELFVANDMGDSILVFSTSAQGDVAPIRVLKGPKTLIKNPLGVYLDPKNNELWVASFGSHTVTVFKATASGDTPPLRVIRSAPLDAPSPMMSNPHPVAYDSKREEILVPN